MTAILMFQPVVAGVGACYLTAAGGLPPVKSYQTWGERTCRVTLLPLHFALQVGVSLFEIKAMLEGLVATVLPSSCSGLDDVVGLIGVAFGLYQFWFLQQTAIASFHASLVQMFVGASFLWVNGTFLMSSKFARTSAIMPKTV